MERSAGVYNVRGERHMHLQAIAHLEIGNES